MLFTLWLACGTEPEPAPPADPPAESTPSESETGTDTGTAPTPTEPTDTDTDEDGLVDADELALGTDPEDPDTDDDEIPDGQEVELGTEPLLVDTDGDGFHDGDEVQSGGDPTDPLVGVYEGNWPYNPDKDALPTGNWIPTASIGSLLPRFGWVDQFGNTVDVYDLAGHGAPVVLQLSAAWAPPDLAMGEWITGATPDFFDVYDETIPSLVADGTVIWVIALQEGLAGVPPSPQAPASFADYLGPVSVPVLADQQQQLLRWAQNPFFPTLVLLEEDLSVAVLSVNGDYTLILEELLARYP